MANGQNVGAANLDAVQDFLHPKSMLTPGMAGGIVMGISTGVGPAVGLDPLHCILGLSFLVGLVVFVSTSNLWLSVVYYVLNSLIISMMAIGMLANADGVTIGARKNAPSEVGAVKQSALPPASRVTVTTVELPNEPTPSESGK